ncbi:hypothetical protein [Kitasatospora sp. NPDC097643]|uniref:hypothetical protein n=1 Tax=Kitasatospora sp. NPDC097643 TaxID=3157230 RepID=UPI003318FDB8
MTTPPPPPPSPGFGPPPGLPTAPGLPATPAAPGPGPNGPSRAARLRRNAVWAFVGALLASAGWAAAVISLPDMVTTASSPRSLGSYHLVDDFCTTGKPTRLFTLYTTSDTSPPSHHSDRHPALESMNCSMSLKRIGAGSGDSEYASAYMRVDLHKAVNPAPEFAASKEVYRARNYKVTDVAGIGEEAYFLYKDDPGTSDKTWHSVSAEIDVRDGGMTYYLSWSASYTDGKTKVPSKEELQSALQADALDALHAIRK